MAKEYDPDELVNMKVRRRDRDKFKSDAARAGKHIYEHFSSLV